MRGSLAAIIVLSLLLPVSVFGDEDLSLEDLFDLSFEDLMKVEITTAGKREEKISETPASVVVITREEIETYGYRTLEDILRNVPGFYMIDDYHWLGSLNFGVRGFFSTGPFNDVTVMVNGVNQIGDSWGDYPFTKINVPVEAIDRIEVIRGPLSVVYGSGAFMGAINIITNMPPEGKAKGLISGSLGTERSKELFVRLSGRNDDFNYVFNGATSSSDGLDMPLASMTSFPGYLEYVGLSESASTKGMLKTSGKYIGVSTSFGNRTLDICHVETSKGVFDGLPSVGHGTNLHTQATNAMFKYERALSEYVTAEASIGYFHHQILVNYELLYEGFFAIEQSNTNSYELGLDFYITPSPRWDVTIGFSRRALSSLYETWDFPNLGPPSSDIEFFIPDDKEVVTSALFTQAFYRLSDRVTLVGGLRLEHLGAYNMCLTGQGVPFGREALRSRYDDDDIKTIPRLALIWDIDAHNILKVMYGEATKQPSIQDNQMIMILDKLQLRPATNKTLELNYLFTPGPDFALNFSLFRNDLNSLIIERNEYDVDRDGWIFWPANSGEMRTIGTETGVKIRPARWLQFDLSGTWQDSDNRQAGLEDIELSYAPKFLGYFKAACFLPRDMSVALVSRFVGSMETFWDNEPLDPAGGDFTPWGRIGEPVSDRFVLDANFRVEDFPMDGAFLNISVENIPDNEIRYPTTTTNPWANLGTLGPGRSFLVTVGAVF